MQIGVPKEMKTDEYRVGLVPATTRALGCERSSRPDHQTCGKASAACGLLISLFREGRRPRSLRVRFN